MTATVNGYFDIKGDIVIEKAGGFFCEACLVAKPPTEDVSPDPRYCPSCYEFLLIEASILPQSQRPKWIPRMSPRTLPEGLVKGDKKEKSRYPIPNHVVLIMSTPGSQETRGRKHRALPMELITRWAGEGMGGKAIAARLKGEHGIKVSYKTIQRLLTGQRVLV